MVFFNSFFRYGDKDAKKENSVAIDQFLPDFMLEEDDAEQLLAKKDEDFKEFLGFFLCFQKNKEKREE